MATVVNRPGGLAGAVAFGAGVIFLLATILLSYFSYSKAVADLAFVAEQSALSMNRLFANLIWPRYAEFAETAAALNPDQLRAHARIRALHREVQQLTADTRILKVKIFDRSGLTVFSTEAAQIGSNSYSSPGLQAALAGRNDSRLEKRAAFTAIQGQVFDRWVVQSYLPVIEENRVAAIMEVYSDMTDGYAEVLRHVYGQIAVTVFTLLAAFFVLVAVVHHVERQIRLRQSEMMALMLAKAEAEASNRAKSTFLANMSHELRTPLNAIIGFAEMIRLEYFGPLGNARYRTYADHITDAGQHLLAIINDVLDLTKIEVGKMRLDREAVDAGQVAASALRMMERDAGRRGVRLVAEIAPDLPIALLDASKLRQILLNLLSNAVKFTPSGGTVTLNVAMSAARQETHMVFTVRDNGIGMRHQDIIIALSPFGQIENPMTRQMSGTGLGLPLAKEFAELMGGTLAVESAPGSGTTVRVVLPLRATATQKEPAPAP